MLLQANRAPVDTYIRRYQFVAPIDEWTLDIKKGRTELSV